MVSEAKKSKILQYCCCELSRVWWWGRSHLARISSTSRTRLNYTLCVYIIWCAHRVNKNWILLSSFLFFSLFLAFLLFIHSTILAFITSSSAFWPRRELIFWKSHISWDVKLEQRPETTNCYSTFEIDNFDSVRSVDSRHGGHHIGSLLCCHILYKKDNAAKARRRESQRKNQVRFQGITYGVYVHSSVDSSCDGA